MSDTEQCETDGCYRQTPQILEYEVWDDGLNYEQRWVCEPCMNAIRFRETFTQGDDAWSLHTGMDQEADR